MTHGNFADNAVVSQCFKNIARKALDQSHWTGLSYVDRESIDNIALKLSRIISGHSRREHWEDIIGYAQLALEACTD